MGMLDRYKKAGGFVQLLKLLETFGPQKQEKFLKMIEEENSIWAEAVKGKMLSVDRIFSWNEEALAEVVHRLPPKNMAVILHGLSEDRSAKVLKFMSHGERRRLEDEKGQVSPSDAEISTSLVKMIECVRGMIQAGEIRLEKVDESLIIDPEIEDSLAQASVSLKSPPSAQSHSEAAPSGGGSVIKVTSPADKGKVGEDELQLRRQVLHLDKENSRLRQENKVLKEKLEQIKKIA